MSFVAAYNQLTRAEQDELDEILKTWEQNDPPFPSSLLPKRQNDGYIIVSNLRQETFLRPSLMKKLLLFIIKTYRSLAHEPYSLGEKISFLKSKIRNQFYGGLQLKGGKLQSGVPRLFGTVVSEDDFKDYLKTDDAYSWDENEIIKDIDTFLATGWLSERLKRATLKEPYKLNWSTWNPEDNGRSNPFSFAYGRRHNLLNDLGLGHFNPRKKVMAFTFDGSQPRVKKFWLYNPTWCDADFNIFFRASSRPYGKTNPLDGNMMKARPESVEKSGNLKLDSLDESNKVAEY